MARPSDDVRIVNIQTRKDGRKKPYIARWFVNGVEFNKGFVHKTVADRHVTDMEVAVRKGERFSSSSGLPVSWNAEKTPSIADWCFRYLEQDRRAYSAKSRSNLGDDLAPLILRSVPSRTPQLPEEQVRSILDWLGGARDLSAPARAWLDRWSPSIGDLGRVELSRILDLVKLRVDGVTPLATSSLRNRIGHIKQVMNSAVDQGVIEPLDWPPAPRGAKKKSQWKTTHRARLVVTPNELKRVIEHSANKHPRSFRYRAMSSVMAFAGLRPGEVLGLRVGDLDLPEEGWGTIWVDEARVDLPARWSVEGDALFDKPKTENSIRDVPIPPVLVMELQSWLRRSEIEVGRVFGRIGEGNWSENLAAACKKAGVRHMSRYDLRRAYSSHCIVAGVDHAEVARRMGHTVAILEKHYTLPVSGGRENGNHVLDAFYDFGPEARDEGLEAEGDVRSRA